MSMSKRAQRDQAGYPEAIDCTLEYKTCCYRDNTLCLRCGWNLTEMHRRRACQRAGVRIWDTCEDENG